MKQRFKVRRKSSKKPINQQQQLPKFFLRSDLTFLVANKHLRSIGVGLLLAAVSVVAYLPALRGGFIWDDDAHLTANPCIVGPLGLKAIWTTSSAVYYPLVLTSFWIGHKLWGLNPLIFHLCNILMHAMNTVILWRVLLQLKVPGAWLGAALWALHPVQVESVAWITELKNTQSCFFYLLAILFFLKWRSFVGDAAKGSKTLDYGLAIFFAVLAILSKASTVILPVVLGLCWWWKGGRWRWRNTIDLFPFLIVSGAASAWTVWEQQFVSGAQGVEWAQSGLERFAIAGKAVWFYLDKLLWPYPLSFIYPRWQLDGPSAISFLPAAAVIFLWVILWLGRNDSRLRSGFFAFTYFLISLFPVMGFFNVYFFRYSFVGDHFQYLASIGIMALVAAALSRSSKATQLLSVVILPTLAILTWQQTRIYRDQESLWRDTLSKNPAAWIAHDNLGVALAAQGKMPEAVQHYERALQSEPADAETNYNLGIALVSQGRVAEGIEHYQRALQAKPDDADAHVNLGIALANRGRVAEGIEHYQRALQLKPYFAEAYIDLGSALVSQGELARAIEVFQRALQLKPDIAEAHYGMGGALAAEGKLPEAVQHYERALQLKPDYADAYVSLGVALAGQGKLPEAVGNFERALQLRPDDADAYNNLKIALARQGKLPQAIPEKKKK